MFWWWGSGPGWFFGLITAAFWVLVIVAAVLLLRRELPHLRWPESRPPAVRLLEERYARGEISREEFLERRRVLLGPTQPAGPAAGSAPPPAEPASASQPGLEPPPAAASGYEPTAPEKPKEGEGKAGGEPTEPIPPPSS